ncbi:MAG: hypothetical protein B7Y90_13915 [Alphaproteobacteria bacterium 32-64-14]|nr:MAG: hypothetical protein B7Y90_13915 [Alphaproteobacteria bacterium 32-64-14]
MKNRDHQSSARREPAAYPKSATLRDFAAFVETLPNRDKRLSAMTTPEIGQAVDSLSLNDQLRVIHTVGPDAVRGLKYRPKQNADKGGRPTGISNRDWGAFPGDVAATYVQHKRKHTKAEAARQTLVHFIPEEADHVPTSKALDRLIRTLDRWAAKDWTEWDRAAWEARNHDRL